ncbi:MAG: Gfo/Idh/MocA family protein [Candidatus Latescibacterota bacterium]
MVKPVRWGVLGIGRHFTLRTLLPMQRAAGVELYGVASRDPEKAGETAKQFNIPRAYGSYEELLADPSIEAVYLPIPNNIHTEWIRKAADAGKHILCEKPLALNAGEARDAFEYASGKGALLMEAFMYRFHPQWVHARDLVRTGHIGNLKAIHTFFGYNNPDPKNIRNRPETGGGAIYDIGCYAVSLSRLLFGREPERVLSCISHDPSMGVDVLTSGILDFGGPRSLFTVGMQVFSWQRVEVFGSGGRIEVKIPFNSYDDIPSFITVATGIGEREVPLGPADQFRLEFEAFSAAVRSGGPAPLPEEDTVANLAVMDALFRSGQSGNWERIE